MNENLIKELKEKIELLKQEIEDKNVILEHLIDELKSIENE